MAIAATNVFYATGRRKTSAARVFLKAGTGKITVNGKNLDDYIVDSVRRQLVFQPFEVTGTKTYATAEGASRTVTKISPFPIQDAKPIIAKLDAQEMAASSQSARTWSDSSGSFKVSATFVKNADGIIHLKRSDNGIPISACNAVSALGHVAHGNRRDSAVIATTAVPSWRTTTMK